MGEGNKRGNVYARIAVILSVTVEPRVFRLFLPSFLFRAIHFQFNIDAFARFATSTLSSIFLRFCLLVYSLFHIESVLFKASSFLFVTAEKKKDAAGIGRRVITFLNGKNVWTLEKMLGHITRL